MKHWTIAMAIFTAVSVIAGGPNDVNLNFGLTPAEAKKAGFNSCSIDKKGVTLLEENGVKFYRMERDAKDPKHRARISFNAPRKCTVYAQREFQCLTAGEDGSQPQEWFHYECISA